MAAQTENCLWSKCWGSILVSISSSIYKAVFAFANPDRERGCLPFDQSFVLYHWSAVSQIVPFLTWDVTVVVTVSGSDTTHNWSWTARLTAQHSSWMDPVVWSSDKQLRNNQIAEPRTYSDLATPRCGWLGSQMLSRVHTVAFRFPDSCHVQEGAV